MQQQHRLGRSRQFTYVYRRGVKASGKDLTLLYVKNTQQRVGFSVSKKVGCAVTRNRTKRRLRECIRPQLPVLKNGLYVIVAHPSAAERSFAQLQRSLEILLHKLALHRGELPPPTSK
ncbi:MAG TPA: ribonuclease P protein component [Candidatus Limiplasma sp.]|nr:ribonuclease P protein component [Candidatus Limiplasma sp.]HPS82615.1 ribonuclease P protein component [Candidatus Limiplasma sp.]